MINELKPIANFVNLSLKEVPGNVAASIYFTDCNLCCNYCYNLKRLQQNKRSALNMGQIKYEILKLIKEGQDKKPILLVDYIVFSGGECTLYTEEMNDLLEFVKDLGFKTCVYTNGFVWNKSIKWYLVDLVSVDFKTTQNFFIDSRMITTKNPVKFESFYMDSVINTLKELDNLGIPCQIRTVLVKPYLRIEDIAFIYSSIQRISCIKKWFLTNCIFGETLDPKLNETENAWTEQEKQRAKQFAENYRSSDLDIEVLN